MRIIRFRGEGVHGFLKFDLKFNDDLTFLTGINGGGKTSALNAILGLITPDLGLLAELIFDNIVLDIVDNDDIPITISAKPTETGVELSVSTESESLVYGKFVQDPDTPPFRSSEGESEYYRELLSAFSSHAVLRKIASIPTPMFLGLDRRPRFGEKTRRPRMAMRVRSRNPITSIQNISVSDAAGLAEDRNRAAVIQASRATEELQQQMLLSLITVVPGEAEDFIDFKLPTDADREQIQTIKKNLSSIANVLGLQQSAVDARLRPLIDKLEAVSKIIPKKITYADIFGSNSSPHDELPKAAFAWSVNQPQLSRIVAASKISEIYNEARDKILGPMTEYVALINEFLVDSGKKILFDELGEVVLSIDGINEHKSISHLSSGEAQLFVILTHLALNKSNTSSVFIIDEPELSLHLRWQELFVESMKKANSSVQYILATHSPSIILDRVEKCLDVDRARPGRGGNKGV